MSAYDADAVSFMGAVIFVGLLMVLLVWFVAQTTREHEACAKRGGHMIDLYKASICVSADGRIIEL